MLPGERTPLLHERLVQVATVGKSFVQAAKVFVSLTRTPVSEPTARRYAERLGVVLDECERVGDASPPPTDAPRPFWVGADGVFVRLVAAGGWKCAA